MIICAPQLGIAPETTLGGEACDREILLGLARLGVKIEILLPKGKPHNKNIKNWHITYVPIAHAPAIFYNLIFLPYLFYLCKKKKFNIIRIHSPRFIGLGCIILKIFFKDLKLVASYHNFWETNFWFFSKLLNNFWDIIVCDSKNVCDKIIKTYNVPIKKVFAIHNGVAKYFKPQKKDKNLIRRYKLNDYQILLFVGLFIKRKNPLCLLDVLYQLVSMNHKVILIYMGYGPLENQIIKKAKKLELMNNIRVIKPILGMEKNKIFNLADIFVHPSTEEGFALVTLEAMACGKPIVISRGYSASEQVINKENGFLCKVNATSEWVNKIDLLLRDKKKRGLFGRKSLARVKKYFQWEYSTKQHLDMLKPLNDA